MPVVILPARSRRRTSFKRAVSVAPPHRRVHPVLNPDDVMTAIDLGAISAYAACVPGHRPRFGHRNLEGPDQGRTFLNLWHWLNEIFAEHQPAIAFCEEPFVPMYTPKKVKLKNGELFDSAATQHTRFNVKAVVNQLYGMRGILRAACSQHHIRFQEYSIAEVAKHFTGAARWPGGRDGKKAATLKMCRLYGFDVGADDEEGTQDKADAGAVLVYAEALLTPRAAQRRGIGPLFIPNTSSTVRS